MPNFCKHSKCQILANTIESDEVAHNEPPHMGLHCLPSRRMKIFLNLQMYTLLSAVFAF